MRFQTFCWRVQRVGVRVRFRLRLVREGMLARLGLPVGPPPTGFASWREWRRETADGTRITPRFGVTAAQFSRAVERLEARRLCSSGAPAGDTPWIYLPDGWLYVPGDLPIAGNKVASTCADG